MSYGFFAIVSAIIVVVVSAQLDITALPDCSSKCAIDSIAATGCALTDYSCMCQNGKLFQLLVPCVSDACQSTKQDQQKTYSVFQDACSSFHVIPPLPSSVLTSSVTPTTSSSSSSSSSTTVPGVLFDLSTIPQCAANCAISAITSTSCSPTDYKCFCGDKNFSDNLPQCVAANSNCSESDQQKMFDLSISLCSVNGVSITIISPTNVGGNHVATSTPVATTPSTTFRATTPTSSPTRTSTSSGNTSTAAAAKFSGSGFVAAAAMAALFVL